MADSFSTLSAPSPPATSHVPASSVAGPGGPVALRSLLGAAYPASLERARAFKAVVGQDWVRSLCYLLLDVAVWLSLYSAFSSLRGEDDTIGGELIAWVCLLQLGVILLALFIVGGYDRRTDFLGLAYTSEHLFALAGAGVVGSLIIYSVVTYGHPIKPSRSVLLVSLTLFTPVSLVYRRLIYARAAASTAKQTFLVLGAGVLAERFFQSYEQSPNRQRLRFVDPRNARVGEPIAGAGSPVIEAGADPFVLAQVCLESNGVILADSPEVLGPELLEYLVQIHYRGTPVYTLDTFYEAHWRRVPVYALESFWPLRLGAHLSRNSPYLHLKRLFDVAFSGVALLLCSPFLLLIGCWVRLDSGWPVLFRQTRVGRDNVPFTVLKFRTMHHNAPRPPAGPAGVDGRGGHRGDDGDDLYTRANDARITRAGRWLRKLRLDELPQLWNVFKSEMSLIGPRAEWDRCVERYEGKIPHYRYRHLVKPGITGWAQVNYPYGASEADAMEKLKYDLYYIRHYSLKLDAMIVLKTLHVMLFGKGQ